MAKKSIKQAVEQRTQQRLAARKEAAKRGVETRQRNREAREHARVAAEAAEPQAQQARAADEQTKRPARNVAQKGRARRGRQASGPMATVALRGDQAERLRALAAKQGLTLSKLLVRMMEVFEVDPQ